MVSQEPLEAVRLTVLVTSVLDDLGETSDLLGVLDPLDRALAEVASRTS